MNILPLHISPTPTIIPKTKTKIRSTSQWLTPSTCMDIISFNPTKCPDRTLPHQRLFIHIISTRTVIQEIVSPAPCFRSVKEKADDRLKCYESPITSLAHSTDVTPSLRLPTWIYLISSISTPRLPHWGQPSTGRITRRTRIPLSTLIHQHTFNV